MRNYLNSFLFFFGLLVSSAASAEIHALLMFIGDYQREGIPKLEGVAHDVPSALSIAHSMGIKDENIQLLQNQELTLEGMNNAFDELDRRVVLGDKVFIYYSGHGGRQQLHDPEERCAESLITVNGKGFFDTELEARLKKLSGRASKIIAMFDSCHSGGVTTRGIIAPKYTPKFWSKGGTEDCGVPTNIITHNINKATRAIGGGGRNYVYIAAAKNDEVSLDQPDKGGFATVAWAECMSGEAHDTDGSGGLTAEEIRVCAQKKIDAKTKGLDGVLPQHISVVGNPDQVMTLVSKKSEDPLKPTIQETIPQVPAPAPSAPATTAPALSAVPAITTHANAAPVPAAPAPALGWLSNLFHALSAPAPTAQAPVASTPHAPTSQEQPVVAAHTESGASATLQDIYNGRDDRRIVEITPKQSKLKIGKDKFSFGLRSSHAGYLYLLMVGSDGQTFDLLFPNKLDKDNHIPSGQSVEFPRSNWEVVAQGPAGKDHILAIVADAPRDLSMLELSNAGPFSVVPATADGKSGIQHVTSISSASFKTECGNSKKRSLVVKPVCSDAYGAALVVVVEEE